MVINDTELLSIYGGKSSVSKAAGVGIIFGIIANAIIKVITIKAILSYKNIFIISILLHPKARNVPISFFLNFILEFRKFIKIFI